MHQRYTHPCLSIEVYTKLQIKVKLLSLFRNQNICCGYSKEPSHGDGSFEHQNTRLN